MITIVNKDIQDEIWTLKYEQTTHGMFVTWV